MAIVSKGYNGTINEVDWAQLSRELGADYTVGGKDDWRVELVAGQDRTVRVLPGTIYGHGVRDVSDAPITLQLPVVSSGSRWDLVVANRNWQPAEPPGGLTSVMSRAGTATQQVPVSRVIGPGVSDDQMLALVQVTAGQTLPTGLLDLRTRASKILSADSLLALPGAPLGAMANVGGVPFRRALDGSGNLVWQPYGALGQLGSATRTAGAGPVTATTTVGGLAAGFTLTARRRLALIATVLATASDVGTELAVGHLINGGQVAGSLVQCPQAGKWQSHVLRAEVDLGPGSYRYEINLAAGGTGSVSLPATSNTPLRLSVEDMRSA